MSTITKERIEQYANDPRMCNVNDEIRQIARIALASLEAEPVAFTSDHYMNALKKAGAVNCWLRVDDRDPGFNVSLYTAPPAPVAVPDEHNSVIAEQLAHVLSGIDVTDHQRAIINCAVDRLNKNAEVIQQKPVYSEVPEALDYQGAKELYNYLMNEEETNATVNGWNACRAAMLQGPEPVTTAYKLRDGWVSVPVEPTTNQWAAGMQAFDSGMDKVTRVYKAMLSAAPQEPTK